MSLPRGGTRMPHSAVLLQGTTPTADPLCCCCASTLMFMVGLHFPRAASSQCMSSMIEDTIAGPFLQDIRLFNGVTWLENLPFVWPKLSLTYPAICLPCKPLLSSSPAPFRPHLGLKVLPTLSAPFLLSFQASCMVNPKAKGWNIILFSL